jgi:chemotaxis protein methyltransferase CheR
MVDAYNVEIVGLGHRHPGAGGRARRVSTASAPCRACRRWCEAYFEPAKRHRRQIINDLRESVTFTRPI